MSEPLSSASRRARRVHGPSSLHGQAARLAAYVRLETSRTVTSGQYALLALLLPTGLVVLFLLAGAAGPAAPAQGGAAGAGHLVAGLATLAALGAGLATGGSRLAADREGGWTRTLTLVPLPPFQIVVGRLLAGFAACALAILVVVLAGTLVAMPGLVATPGLDPARWFLFAVSVWVGTAPLVLTGMIVGASLGRRAAVVAVVGLYAGLAIGGGLLAPVGSTPAALGTILGVLPTSVVDDLGWRALLGQGLSAHDVTLLAAESLALAALLTWSGRRA